MADTDMMQTKALQAIAEELKTIRQEMGQIRQFLREISSSLDRR
jgi:hypothetical protein